MIIWGLKVTMKTQALSTEANKLVNFVKMDFSSYLINKMNI